MLEQQVCNDILAHMNADHPDAVLCYAQAFAPLARRLDSTAAKLTAIDESSVTLACSYTHTGSADSAAGQPFSVSLTFAATGAGTAIADANDARRVLIRMARLARERLQAPGDAAAPGTSPPRAAPVPGQSEEG